MVPTRMPDPEIVLSGPGVPCADGPPEGAARGGGVRPRRVQRVLPQRVRTKGGDGHRFDLCEVRGSLRAVAPRGPSVPPEGGDRGRRAAPAAPAERPDGGGAPARGDRAQRSTGDGGGHARGPRRRG